jgi:hypothetical protein
MRMYIKERLSDSWQAVAGAGSFVVPVPFVPDYVKIEFLDINHDTIDTTSYTLEYIGAPTETYRLTVNWNVVGKPRVARYTVAKLSDFEGIA